MSERERGSAFAVVAVAAACAVAAALVLPWRTGGGEAERPRAIGPSAPLVIAGGTRPRRARPARRMNGDRHAAEDLALGVRPSPAIFRRAASARRVARGFLAALLHYESGDTSTSVRQALRASASKELARQLLSRVPRVPPGRSQPPRGRLVSLALLPDQGGASELAATIARGARRSGLLLELREEGGWWAVAALR